MGDIKNIISKLTVEEKAALCTGRKSWHFKGVPQYDIKEIMVCDGPHGLRKQDDDADTQPAPSLPATCFPTASALASSWNRELLGRIGGALGTECRAEGVAVLLGPGVNIKRSPLCGRNFEYFSEDPLLSGELASAMINGIQSGGTGCSLKHFAANNQESLRMTIDSVIDERSLREIYLRAFEICVKKSSPRTIMCAYNRVNGEYASENRKLLTDILRDEWGWNGVMITDWGSCNERLRGLAAGQDIEMPDSGPENPAIITAAVKQGNLPETVLDRTAERILSLLAKAAEAEPAQELSPEKHHNLAKEAASESIVLLKNEDAVLPLKSDDKIAVTGEFALKPRYQGAGSSRVNPTRLDSFLDEIKKHYPDTVYSAGYSLNSDSVDLNLIEKAVKAAAGADKVIILGGLPDEYESEGFDRNDLMLPESHNALIKALAAAGKKVIVCLSNGAPVQMPWHENAHAILECYLGGQAGGGALAEILTGDINPSGKLAESFPLSLDDCPSRVWFPGGPRQVEYREGLYVGYRYYNTAGVQVLYPFGHGLSYTSFSYSGLKLSNDKIDGRNLEPEDKVLELSYSIKNSGGAGGSEVSQLYLGAPGILVHRPALELKDFTKTKLAAGESAMVNFSINLRAFAHWDSAEECWTVEPGRYRILIGSSSEDIRLEAELELISDWKPEAGTAQSGYFSLKTDARFIHRVPDAVFKSEYGRELPQNIIKKGFDRTTTLQDFSITFIGKILLKFALKSAKKESGGNESSLAMYEATARQMPLRSVAAMSGRRVTFRMVDALIEMGNGRFFMGLLKLGTAAFRRK